MRRILFSVTAAVICGIFYQSQIHAFPALFVAAGCLGFLYFAKGRGAGLLLALAFLAGCALLPFYQWQHQIDSEALLGQQKDLTVRVKWVEEKAEDSFRICCETEGERILLSYYHPISEPWELLGREISVSGTVEKPKGAGNPRTFDYKTYLKSQGIGYIMIVERIEVTSAKVSLFSKVQSFVLKKRTEMMQGLNLSEEETALIKGMLFGDTNALSEEVYEDFRRNGTAHVLAVSGLHVAMIYGIYRKLSQKRKSLLFTAAFVVMLLLYSTAAMWSVSVTRAVILVLLALGGEVLERRYDLLTALSAAALFAAVRNPYVVFGAGFQMSYLAVLSMAFFMPPLQKKAGETFGAALAVQAGLIPYIAYTFNYVSIGGFFCNFPIVFLVSLIVPAGVLGFFVFMASGIMVPLLPELLGGLAMITDKLNSLFASVKFLAFDVTSPPLWCIAALYGILFFLSSEYFQVIWMRKEFRRLKGPAVILTFVLVLSGAAGYSPFDRADIVFLDVGQGDSVHIKGERGQQILIDGGGNLQYNVGEKTLKPYLLKNGVSELDLAAATHLHTDHFLGLTQLKACFAVKQLLTEGQAGEYIQLSESQRIEILWPLEKGLLTEDENLNSLIFKVHMDGFSVLVTGDITAEGEEMLIEHYRGTDKLEADILKAAHHGSAYSSCDAFLDAVKPSAAVISVGKNNYGHPSQKVIEKLEKKGIMIIRTDQKGAVGIRNQRGKIRICTENP